MFSFLHILMARRCSLKSRLMQQLTQRSLTVPSFLQFVTCLLIPLSVRSSSFLTSAWEIVPGRNVIYDTIEENSVLLEPVPSNKQPYSPIQCTPSTFKYFEPVCVRRECVLSRRILGRLQSGYTVEVNKTHVQFLQLIYYYHSVQWDYIKFSILFCTYNRLCAHGIDSIGSLKDSSHKNI